MDQLRTLRTFIAVAERASFAQAARYLHMSPATVTRTIAALEAKLGVALLARTTRSVGLTEQGAAFLENCRAGLAEIDAAFEAVRGTKSQPSGTLTITTPVMFGRLHIMPVVEELLQTYPDLNIRLLLVDRMVRLVDEGVDVAVRIANLPDSALRMIKIGSVRSVFSASDSYLAGHDIPRRRADLRDHHFIAIDDEGANDAMVPDVRRDHGAVRLSVNSVEAGIAAAIAGLGIVRTLRYQVREHWKSGRLREIPMDIATDQVPISLLFQNGRRDTPNIRAFVELARDRLKNADL